MTSSSYAYAAFMNLRSALEHALLAHASGSTTMRRIHVRDALREVDNARAALVQAQQAVDAEASAEADAVSVELRGSVR